MNEGDRVARVFVVGAHLPHGGTYMAYHLGRIVAKRLGFEPVAVQVRREEPGAGGFDHVEPLPSVSFDHMLDVADRADVLVCNPSFSDRLLGLRFAGRSLMYVQGVNTYRVIDGFYNHYVAVSDFVRRHLRLHYGWDVAVIPPFVAVERIHPLVPWTDRPPASALVFPKAMGAELVSALRARLAAIGSDVELTVIEPMPQEEFFALMQQHRYFVPLSPLEGHPLTPLEAMRSGCCVAGFHGGGGADYLRSGHNGVVVGYPRLDALVDELQGLLADPARGERLAQQGTHDAGQFTYARFEDRWMRYADEHLLT